MLFLIPWGAGVAQSLVSDNGLGDLTIEVRPPAEARGFLLYPSLCDHIGPGPHPASCTTGTGGAFPGPKGRPGRDADHSLPSSVEIVNE
jgi:hypothetical protein